MSKEEICLRFPRTTAEIEFDDESETFQADHPKLARLVEIHNWEWQDFTSISSPDEVSLPELIKAIEAFAEYAKKKDISWSGNSTCCTDYDYAPMIFTLRNEYISLVSTDDDGHPKQEIYPLKGGAQTKI